MSIKHVMVYVSICLLLLAILTFSVWRKSHPGSEAAVPQKKIASDQPVSFQDTHAVADKEDKTSDDSYMTGSLPSGRNNPFAKLPMEELFNDNAETLQPSGEITNPTFVEPTIKETGSVRGIILGKNPAAYVEAPDGSLRKVRIGDAWLGGKIVFIKEDCITIRRGNDTITQKLGE